MYTTDQVKVFLLALERSCRICVALGNSGVLRVCPALPASTFCGLTSICKTWLVDMDLEAWVKGTNVEGSVQILV
ncbi:hypothetical protein CEP51_010420 [Fusarium floridanum]|uniref:Uncharacterized protein n=1 Tax=Fusarium floridanum TaxID=1325733 RepID=A0A428REK2_9HYPO|nr:hypothetical protein CEP51_010420 [Fusarium floridanum]